MKKSSAVKIGAAICASAVMFPVAIAQPADSGPKDPPAVKLNEPAKNAAGPQAKVPGDTSDQTRDAAKSQADSGEPSPLDSVKQTVTAAKFDDRENIAESVSDTIVATKNEEESLQDSVEKMSAEAQGRFRAVTMIADTRRDVLESRLEALKKADSKDWSSSKSSLVTAIDQYAMAIEREREIASGNDQAEGEKS